MNTAEHRRLAEGGAWKKWGPYLAERAWGTVREDYSSYGSAWDYFSHDQARSRVYRWNEDGLAGISDQRQFLCFAMALWNEQDPILKERLFGLTGPEGNHGEDVKEQYFYLDSTPTHSYMKMLYKYPQQAFPYRELVEENSRRGRLDPEFELIDTGAFDEDRYFDTQVEYAKAGADDVLVRITVTNRGPEAAVCHILPTLWSRNTWSWGYASGPMEKVMGRPVFSQERRVGRSAVVKASHPAAGDYHLYAEAADDLLFTDNETNAERLWGSPNSNRYTKDAFHRFLVEHDDEAVNPDGTGTKAAAWYQLFLAASESETLRLRLSAAPQKAPFKDFDDVVAVRLAEADEFYNSLHPDAASPEERSVQRQALAGMMWTKQLYYYDVEQWLNGDPGTPPPPPERAAGRNRDWRHLNNFDVISVCDKWEYPWYAAWDLAFHSLPLARLDAEFAKGQLDVMTREWYMHPNGQLPAYEWALSDVNPPVHAWAVRRVYELDHEQTGVKDTAFLERLFHKLLLNFTWWVNRKDAAGNNVFQGGFLGLDNISVFDRSAMLPAGGRLDQSDGTAWMGFYTLEMLAIALELSKTNPVYQDLATKFFEHFLSIAAAMTAPDHCLWDENDGFFYDVLRLPDGTSHPLMVRSMVGLMPLLAVTVIDEDTLASQQGFVDRLHWFLRFRPHIAGGIAEIDPMGHAPMHLVSILSRERLQSVLRYMLDESEFLSPHGIRSVSKAHGDNPYSVEVGGQIFSINYQPAESESGLFGGNSNWRGPVWFPINYLLIEALERFHSYYQDDFSVECPTGSGVFMNLHEVAEELSQRMIRLFLPDRNGRRPSHGDDAVFAADPNWSDLVLFYEYFNGDNGAGLGASHQTGWTGLVAELINRCPIGVAVGGVVKGRS